MQEQRRGRVIAMTPEERDAFLTAERTCRVGSLNGEGAPHVSALWFVWDGTALWLNSITRSQRWTDLMRDPRVSVLVDGGHDYGELQGVELRGRVESVGEVPRESTPNEELREVEEMYGRKYSGGAFQPDGRHAWLRVVPEKIVSWDFRKLPAR
jgi:nitroimidazol reductase NimA-like FMN-containing flavoprotein (pyridoxamine 5'-phosphate oxidase superfamily)